jgi:hypothetical protein
MKEYFRYPSLFGRRTLGPERFPEIIDFACRDGDKKFLIFVSGHHRIAGGEFCLFHLYDQQHHGLVLD